MLEKADVPPAQARAIVRAIEIEIAGATDTLATKHDLLLLRAELRQEIGNSKLELRQESGGLRQEMATMRGDLRAEIGNALVTFEAFKVWSDEIHSINAFFKGLPISTARFCPSSDPIPGRY